MAGGSEFSIPANLSKLLESKMKDRGLKPATAYKIISIILQESRTKQRIAIRELLEEESVAD